MRHQCVDRQTGYCFLRLTGKAVAAIPVTMSCRTENPFHATDYDHPLADLYELADDAIHGRLDAEAALELAETLRGYDPLGAAGVDVRAAHELAEALELEFGGEGEDGAEAAEVAA